MSSFVLTLRAADSQAVLQRLLQPGVNETEKFKQELCAYIKSLGTIRQGSIDVQTGSANPVAASGTLTLVSAVATDAITIGAVTMTATSTPSLETDWEIDGADDTADAAALAAAINAHSTLSQIVTATSSAGVVTITAKQKGVVGNYIPLSSGDATITASGAFLAGGTGGAAEAAVTYSLGL